MLLGYAISGERTLELLLTPTGPHTRVTVATHPATETSAKIGTTRGETVYELFYTALPQGAFTPADVVTLMKAQLTLHLSSSTAVWSTNVSYMRPLARPLWAAVGVIHRRMVPYLLGRAASFHGPRRSQALTDREHPSTQTPD